MKKMLALLLACLMIVGLLAGCAEDKGNEATTTDPTETKKPENTKKETKIAFITDFGGVTAETYNKVTEEAIKKWADANAAKLATYKVPADNNVRRNETVRDAVSDGNEIVVVAGSHFGQVLADVAGEMSMVKFIALDVSKDDVLKAAVANKGEKYDNNAAKWELEKYLDVSNIHFVSYQEEVAGYMAGVAAVRMGYEKLGVLTATTDAAMTRYAYGFAQGANDAAKELNIADKVTVDIACANQIGGGDKIKAYAENWYANDTQLIFTCGGDIYTSVAEAAKTKGGKMICTDVDHAAVVADKYGKDIVVSSVVKNLASAVTGVLQQIKEDKWKDLAGKFENLGVVNAEDMTRNYVQMAGTVWAEGKFAEADYKALAVKLQKGEIKVSADITAAPKTDISVADHGNIK